MNGGITRDEKFHSLSLKSHYMSLSEIIQSWHIVPVSVLIRVFLGLLGRSAFRVEGVGHMAYRAVVSCCLSGLWSIKGVV